MAHMIIFGAGKIARGFIAHLLFRAGHELTFIEKNAALVRLLNERGQYAVHVLGAPEKDTVISGFRAVSADDGLGIAGAMQTAQVIFTAVGGKNLTALAPVIAAALQTIQPRLINVITCENWQKPADLLKREIARIAPGITAGFAESVVMRSAIEPDAETLARDPLAVMVQDYWHLPVDADQLVGDLPIIDGIEPTRLFAGFLERKFYTYNAANGTVSFLGALLGYRILSEAARDERIRAVLDQVYLETGKALSIRHGIPLAEQMAFAGTSRQKLEDPVIVDTIERNARDPLRKLGPEDRLVGSARLARSYHIQPDGLATAIAAAIHYVNPEDPSALELQCLLARQGSAAVLVNVCGLQPEDGLHQLALDKERLLRSRQWIR